MKRVRSPNYTQSPNVYFDRWLQEIKRRLILSIAAQKKADANELAAALCGGKTVDNCNEKDGDSILAALNTL